MCVFGLADTTPATSVGAQAHINILETFTLADTMVYVVANTPLMSSTVVVYIFMIESSSDHEMLLFFVPYIGDMSETELMDLQMEVLPTIKNKQVVDSSYDDIYSYDKQLHVASFI